MSTTKMSLLALAGLACASCSDARIAVQKAPHNVKAAADIYTVRLEKGVDRVSLLAGLEIEPKHQYDLVFNGFNAAMTEDVVAKLQEQPGVVAIEQDYYVEAIDPVTDDKDEAQLAELKKYWDAQQQRQANEFSEDERREVRTQSVTPNWGLDRMDQADLPLSQDYNYEYTGKGVHVWVVDTGNSWYHKEFPGRWGASYDGTLELEGNVVSNDCHGHGTHVAGLAAGSVIGAAKDSTVHWVKISEECVTSLALTGSIVSGIEWTLQSIINLGRPASVVNYSYSSGACDGPAPCNAFEAAVMALTENNVTFFPAAGNSDLDSCPNSGARLDTTVTVGSSTITDERSSFSNHGACVDIYAPGSLTLSSVPAVYLSTVTTGRLADFNEYGLFFDPDYTIISGTSMATPMAIGVAALMLEAQPDLTPVELREALILNSVTDRLAEPLPPNSHNRLVQSRFDMEALLAVIRPQPEAEVVVDEDGDAEGSTAEGVAAANAAAAGASCASGSANSSSVASLAAVGAVAAVATVAAAVSAGVAYKSRKELAMEKNKNQMHIQA